MSTPLFDRVALIGIGLIGSSLALAMKKHGLAGHIAVSTRRAETLSKAQDLGLSDSYSLDAAQAVQDADLVMVCTPMGAYEGVAKSIHDALKPGAIVSDVGSVKSSAIKDLKPHLPDHAHLIPGHPIAGTENSGPEAGFAELFPGRWTILTPEDGTDADAIAKVKQLWQGVGADVEVMSPDHHDRVLAITSHLPHLIAFSIVDTADQLADEIKQEVIQYSASGFRDFTRIAAGDPVMWRDIFLNNRDAVLDVLGRFTEDLTQLQRAIRKGDGDFMETTFGRAQAVRRSIIDAKQHTPDVKPDEEDA
ncbi:prephenate/arogenate dehydrogenase family protein [Magnetovibrio sp. PR-2]|uniref:prephenate/arogenate dehydrogenase family protein n=1 Tax=Magnetovibrio sp. PR-2 TaxID=3120356 RepID=UPI002FCE253E